MTGGVGSEFRRDTEYGVQTHVDARADAAGGDDVVLLHPGLTRNDAQVWERPGKFGLVLPVGGDCAAREQPCLRQYEGVPVHTDAPRGSLSARCCTVTCPLTRA